MELLSLFFKLCRHTLSLLSLQFMHAVFLHQRSVNSRGMFHSGTYPDPVETLVAIPWPSPFRFIIKSLEPPQSCFKLCSSVTGPFQTLGFTLGFVFFFPLPAL